MIWLACHDIVKATPAVRVVEGLNGAEMGPLFLLSDELTEFGDGVSVAGCSTGRGEAFQEGRVLGAIRLGYGIFVKMACKAEALQGIGFREQGGTDLGAVNSMCINRMAANTLKA